MGRETVYVRIFFLCTGIGKPEATKRDQKTFEIAFEFLYNVLKTKGQKFSQFLLCKLVELHFALDIVLPFGSMRINFLTKGVKKHFSLTGSGILRKLEL